MSVLRPRSFAVILALAANAVAPSWPAVAQDLERLVGNWSIVYDDPKTGRVTGRAAFAHDGARVILSGDTTQHFICNGSDATHVTLSGLQLIGNNWVYFSCNFQLTLSADGTHLSGPMAVSWYEPRADLTGHEEWTRIIPRISAVRVTGLAPAEELARMRVAGEIPRVTLFVEGSDLPRKYVAAAEDVPWSLWGHGDGSDVVDVSFASPGIATYGGFTGNIHGTSVRFDVTLGPDVTLGRETLTLNGATASFDLGGRNQDEDTIPSLYPGSPPNPIL